MGLEVFDIALRGATCTLFVMLMLLFWNSRIEYQAKLAFTFLTVTVACRVWSTLPPGLELPESLLFAFRMIGAFGTLMATWFMLTIFLDDRRSTWIWLCSAALLSIGVIATYFDPEFLSLPVRILVALHFIALVALVIRSGEGDLLNARRQLRPAMALFLGVYCVGLAVTSTPMRGPETTAQALGQSTGAVLAVFFFALWALKVNLNRWAGEIDKSLPQPKPRAEIAGEQTLLIKRINAAMSEGIWQVEGLTVAGLAQKVGAPEHQVRKAINQQLGHRNFASFINQSRIEAAKTRLSDPEQFNATVLEIAYDVGFSSPGPFNRAFRDVTGRSPTEYRKEKLAAVEL